MYMTEYIDECLFVMIYIVHLYTLPVICEWILLWVIGFTAEKRVNLAASIILWYALPDGLKTGVSCIYARWVASLNINVSCMQKYD